METNFEELKQILFDGNDVIWPFDLKNNIVNFDEQIDILNEFCTNLQYRVMLTLKISSSTHKKKKKFTNFVICFRN